MHTWFVNYGLWRADNKSELLMDAHGRHACMISRRSETIDDEVTKGAVAAIEENKLGTKVAAYGIDISNPDIDLMTKKDSPWKATATTDPRAIGAGVTRAMALQIAGQLHEKQVIFPGVLVTQAFLLQEQIKNLDDLRAKLPGLNLASIASAPWIQAATF